MKGKDRYGQVLVEVLLSLVIAGLISSMVYAIFSSIAEKKRKEKLLIQTLFWAQGEMEKLLAMNFSKIVSMGCSPVTNVPSDIKPYVKNVFLCINVTDIRNWDGSSDIDAKEIKVKIRWDE